MQIIFRCERLVNLTLHDHLPLQCNTYHLILQRVLKIAVVKIDP